MSSSRRIATPFLLMLALGLPIESAESRPQIVLRPQTSQGPGPPEVLPPGHGLSQVVRGGRALRSRTEDANGPLRVIVQFDCEPAATAAIHGGDPSLARSRARQLQTDLAALAAARRSPDGSPAVAGITREYSQAFSGASLTVAPQLVDRLRSLPYVRGVFRDDVVRTTLDQSVPLIRADRVRTELGGTGAGIRVGVIDTGIDYDHGAFGGGFGPGHRVAGGYDFVNIDEDPRDDHGHGTHVAGIVGGNGDGVVGVAPEVTLYAFKALDAYGFGYASWILAALDRVLDPDENPGTPDAMHVVNMSFGTWDGDPDDPVSVAVDNLSVAGVVCVAAAGNLGTYFGIGSPGAARRAVTVGASDREDALAYFSSRGPVSGTLDLKPDLLAPGYQIVSAALGEGQAALSGTSMATPHVAGVAAQLLQLHPTWSPDQVKGALVGGSTDLLLTPFQQGAGRLDAYTSATATVAFSPSHLSYGRIDGGVPAWSDPDTLQVINLTGEERQVTFPASVSIAPGASLSLVPSTVTLPAGGSAEVVVELSVDNALVPFPATEPYGYSGSLVAMSGVQTYRVPVSFHKAAQLSVQSAGFIDWLIVHDRQPNGFVFSSSVAGPILLPPGSYDVMASFYPNFRFVVRENVAVDDDLTLVVDPSEATLQLDFANVGPDGTPAVCNHGLLTLYDTGSEWGFNYIGFPFDQILASPASSTYRLEWTRSETNGRDREVTFSGGVAGIASSQTFSNLPGDLRHLPLDYPQCPAPSVGPLVWRFSPDRVWGTVFGFGTFDTAIAPILGPFTYDHWFMPPPNEGHFFMGHAIDLYPWEGGPVNLGGPPVVLGSRRRLDRGWPIEGYLASFFDPPWFRFGGDRMRQLTGAPVWRGRFRNNVETIVLDAGPELYVPHLVSDMYANMMIEPDPAFTLSQNGTPVLTDTLRGAGGFSHFGPILLPVPPGAYDFRTSRPFTLRGRSARLDVDAHMDTRFVDPDPPSLRSLQVYANGAATDSIAFGDAPDAAVRFRMTDANPQPPTVSVREGPAGSWTTVPVVQELDEYVAQLSPDLAGDIALRIESQDTYGNTMALTWAPAFIALPQSVTSAGRVESVGLSLRGVHPNPARADQLWVTFTLPSRASARLTILDVAGRRVGVRDFGAEDPGERRARMDMAGPATPGVYFLRLEHAGRVITSRFCLLH